MDYTLILEKLLPGLSDKNIKLSDLRKLILDLGLGERIKGSHHISKCLTPGTCSTAIGQREKTISYEL